MWYSDITSSSVRVEKKNLLDCFANVDIVWYNKYQASGHEGRSWL